MRGLNLRDIVLALHVLAVIDQGEILGHLAALDSVEARLLERVGKVDQFVVLVELATECEPARPCVDGSDRVGRGLVTLLVLTVVASDGTMSSLRLHNVTIRGDQFARHETERTEALRRDIRDHVAYC